MSMSSTVERGAASVRTPGRDMLASMEATFFVSSRENATGIHAWTDIPSDPASEPLRVASIRGIRSLATALGADADEALTQVTDATCRSFPVWMFSDACVRALRGLANEEVEEVAKRWRSSLDEDELDADLYELETLLADLQRAARAARPRTIGQRPGLFVLLEQKAF